MEKLLIETFCREGGRLLHLPYHRERICRSVGDAVPLEQFIEAVDAAATDLVATDPAANEGTWRVTVTYSEAGIEGVRMIPYQLPEIQKLRVIPLLRNFYSSKWADRSFFDGVKEFLYYGVEPLFTLNGLVTDTSFTNLLFEREGRLFTPKSYLLGGTKRAQLLDKGIVEEVEVTVDSISDYDRVHLVNAMLDPGELTVPTSNIIV
ncbi:MAG: aminotransferase class IV [Porphyromonas sp.]|nr:aminotransferase class IV [Porphyromonas sp.]